MPHPVHPSQPPEPLSGPVFSSFWLRPVAGPARLMLVGELDLVTAGHARAALRNAQDDERSLICDLGDVWFVGLAGVRALVEAADRAARIGRRLTVVNCPPIVPRMLELLRLEDALDIRATPAAAAPREIG